MAKINVKSINPVSVSMLSDFRKTNLKIKDLKDTLNANNSTPLAKIEEIKNARKKAIADGMSVNDALTKYSTEEYEKTVNANIEKYKSEVKPLKKEKSEMFKSINVNFYNAYKLAFADLTKINYKATGNIKDGDDTVKIDNKCTFYACIKDFFEKLGFKALEDDKAMTKAVDSIVAIIGGLKLDNATMGIKSKSKSDMREMLFRATIEYLIARECLEVTEDGGLAKVEK